MTDNRTHEEKGDRHMMNFTGDTKIVGGTRISGTDSASHTPGTLLGPCSPDTGTFDLSASLHADSYTSAL